MTEMQNKRISINVGGTKYETTIQTLNNDPAGLLSRMISADSPMKPYEVDNLYTYFIDRDPRHFRFVLNYLRNINFVSMARLLPAGTAVLEEILVEAKYYQLAGLQKLCERKIQEYNY
ncbi:BTB/POZ domain-containing protein KCTD5-like [Argopecten irradians]|uniref:BTB/POZ domain-containing protein KCTD5-like n=1 Tax=Argopecten irradians TaxID=31199 RepID=UPI00371764DE